ncbi:VOC family protein [Streptomyces decoyicus]
MGDMVHGLGVGAADSEKPAHFCAEALGRDVASAASPAFATLDPDGATPRLSFHHVPEPKSVKNRLHLDLISPTFKAESQRLIALGASRIRDVAQALPAGRRSPTPKATSATSSRDETRNTTKR